MATTSGTTTFTVEVDQIIEEAFEPLGGEHISGEDSDKARRLINLILIELQNKDIPLAKLAYVSLPLVQGQQDYTLDTSYVDILELNLKRDSVENPLTRYGLREFHQVPTKDQTGRPSVYTVERLRSGLNLKVWPTSDLTTDTVEMMVSKKVEDVDASFQIIDLPYRYYPAIVAWLSYRLSFNRKGVDINMRQELKALSGEILADALEEDRERVSSFVRPGGISGR